MQLSRRRALFGLAPSIVMASVVVDQFYDPLARVPVPEGAEHPPTVYRRADYVILVPPRADTWTDRPCEMCGASVHTVSGQPVYTLGCSPAALPRGKVAGLAWMDIPSDVSPHPIALGDHGVSHSACPGTQPHSHPDIVWE